MNPTHVSVSHWGGRILSALVVLALLGDAAVSMFAPGSISEEMATTGWPIDTAPLLAGIMLLCADLYAIPATAILGAILITGFLGGAICTHVRIGEIGSPPQLVCLLLGLMAWGGLYLREGRLRALLPIRR